MGDVDFLNLDLPYTMCVLQRVAVYCSVLQCVAVCCSVLQCVAVCCSVLQCENLNANFYNFKSPRSKVTEALLIKFSQSTL